MIKIHYFFNLYIFKGSCCFYLTRTDFPACFDQNIIHHVLINLNIPQNVCTCIFFVNFLILVQLLQIIKERVHSEYSCFTQEIRMCSFREESDNLSWMKFTEFSFSSRIPILPICFISHFNILARFHNVGSLNLSNFFIGVFSCFY